MDLRGKSLSKPSSHPPAALLLQGNTRARSHGRCRCYLMMMKKKNLLLLLLIHPCLPRPQPPYRGLGRDSNKLQPTKYHGIFTYTHAYIYNTNQIYNVTLLCVTFASRCFHLRNKDSFFPPPCTSISLSTSDKQQ